MTGSTAPIFVLCYARSGSTLLRYILDTHSQIVAPPELHLLLTARQLAWVFEHTAEIAGGDRPADVTAYAVGRVRETITAIMEEHAARAGKDIWAEKSVSSVDHIDLLEQLYPEARLILLHRLAPDTMASCAQAAQSRQGIFGFEPFLATTMANPIDGLADYWIDKTQRLLDAEERAAQACLRLRYEDLVGEPQAALETLLGFLGLPMSPDMLDSIFTTTHVVGPGDGKILNTTTIRRDSVGHGQRLTMSKLSADRREKIDALHARLGYPPLSGAA